MWVLLVFGRLRNDLYCVGRDVKPYSLTVSVRQYFKLDALEQVQRAWVLCMATILDG